MLDCVGALVAVWMSLAPWWGDRHETPEERSELYTPVAVAFCSVARGPIDVARLGWQAYAETKLARAILEWRCHDMPKGIRCDDGDSIGPLQVQSWCPDPWNHELTDLERYIASARCVLGLGRRGQQRWPGVPGAWFQYQAGQGYTSVQDWAKGREHQAWRFLDKLNRHEERVR